MNIYFLSSLIVMLIYFMSKLIYFKNSGLLHDGADISKTPLFFVLVSIYIILITGLRGGFSPDYYNYTYLFEASSRVNFTGILNNTLGVERGYILINKFVYMISSNPVFLMIVIAMLTIFSYMYVYHKYSSKVWLSVVLLLCLGSYFTIFNTMRQFFAASLTFLASKYIYEKNFMKYTVSILAISSIHSSAIIMLPFYFLLQVRWNKIINLVIAAGLMMIYTVTLFFYKDILDFITKYFLPEYNVVDAFGVDNGVSFFYVLRPLVLICILLLYLKYIDMGDLKQRVWLNSVLFWLIISFLTTKVEIIQRFTYFFIPYSTLLIPQIIYNAKEKKVKLLILLIFLCFALSYSLVTNWDGIYYFFWE